MVTPVSQLLRVLLVDDDPFTLLGLASTVRAFNVEVVAEAGDAPTAMRAAHEHRPDAAIVDLDLGEGPTGIDLARAMRRDLPNIGIVMVSTYTDPRLMGHNQAPLPDGSIYLVKRAITEPGVLERALLASLDPESEPVRKQRRSRASESLLAQLSDHQIEVWRLVAAGCSNSEISRLRSINEPSVEKAIARLIKHFDLKATKGQNQRVMLVQAYYDVIGMTRARTR